MAKPNHSLLACPQETGERPRERREKLNPCICSAYREDAERENGMGKRRGQCLSYHKNWGRQEKDRNAKKDDAKRAKVREESEG